MNDAYYNSTDGVSYVWDGSSWQIIAQDGTGGSGTANSLNQAYNEGGPGAGRIITSNAGAVEINLTGGGTRALEISSSVPNSFGIDATQNNTGVAIRALNTNVGNTFASLQGETNSNSATNSAILGSNSGAGYGVSGQIPPTATGFAAVLGNNLRTNGGAGVTGVGVNGVVGDATNINGFGVYGGNVGTVPNSIGVYGIGWTNVYGELPTDLSGWAGYFNFDVNIQGGNLYVNGVNISSDERLKTNIVTIENALDKILLLDGKHYSKSISNASKKELDGKNDMRPFNEREKLEFGIIAQDLEKVFPDMVQERAIFSGSGDETLYKTVDYTQLIPVLIEGIKELKSEVDTLKQEIKELKSQQ